MRPALAGCDGNTPDGRVSRGGQGQDLPALPVIDMHGEIIPGLYCGGESAGGFSQHGLARATCQGFIAGRHAVSG
jgi:hypothetical protein